MNIMNFNLKTIDFLGSHKVIVCQNENGPCPLIALANALLLQNKIFIHPDRSFIDFNELCQIVAECLVESSNNNNSRNSLESSIYTQQLLNDVLTIMPTLIHGLDLNIKFSGVADFEYTKELSVFDALGVSIYHGWIVDPQAKETSAVLQQLSYNQAVNKIVEYHSLSDVKINRSFTKINSNAKSSSSSNTNTSVSVTMDVEEKISDNCVGNVVTNTSHTSDNILSNSTTTANIESLVNNIESVDIINTPTTTTSTTTTATTNSDEDVSDSYVMIKKLHINNKINHVNPSIDTDDNDNLNTNLTTPTNVTNPAISEANISNNNTSIVEHNTNDISKITSTDSGIKKSDDNDKAPSESANQNTLEYEGLIIETFLNETASQFTYEGCHQLHTILKENQLAVFFRNNHFSTIYKCNGLIYLLVTDQGYLKVPQIVWEKVNDISSSEFTDAHFNNFLPFTQSQEYRQITGDNNHNNNNHENTPIRDIDHSIMNSIDINNLSNSQVHQQNLIFSEIHKARQEELKVLMLKVTAGEEIDSARLDYLLTHVQLESDNIVPYPLSTAASNSSNNNYDNTLSVTTATTTATNNNTTANMTIPTTTQVNNVAVGVPVQPPSWAPSHLLSHQTYSNDNTPVMTVTATPVSTNTIATTTTATVLNNTAHANSDYELALQLQRQEEDLYANSNNHQQRTNTTNNRQQTTQTQTQNRVKSKSITDDCIIS